MSHAFSVRPAPPSSSAAPPRPALVCLSHLLVLVHPCLALQVACKLGDVVHQRPPGPLLQVGLDLCLVKQLESGPWEAGKGLRRRTQESWGEREAACSLAYSARSSRTSRLPLTVPPE